MQIIIEIIGCILIALIPASANQFLDFCFGKPMSDNVDTKAILFRWSLFLAEKALPEKKYRDLVSNFATLLNSDDEETRKQGQDQFKLSVVHAGREYFTYQQALGMCKFCTNFWFALITSIICLFLPFQAINPIFLLVIIPVFSHSILRKL